MRKKFIYPTAVFLSVSLLSCVTENKNEEKVETVATIVKEEPVVEPEVVTVVDMDETYLNDVNGQWAITAKASSTYASKTGGNASWSPEQMIGEPNVKAYGDNGFAWASKDQDKQKEWVKLTFEKEVNATEIRVKQTYNPGAITKIELIDTDKNSYVVYENTAATSDASMQYLVASFEKTEYKTKTVKITIDSPSVPGWNEIDAVQLVGE